MRIWLDTSPLRTGHAHRGIGAYTRFLLRGFEELPASEEVAVQTDVPDEPDLIHYPFFDLFFSTLPTPKKTPVVVTIHDVIPLVFPQQFKPGIKGTIRHWQQRLRLQKVAGVITDSECSRRDIQRLLGVPADRIWMVPLAGNPDLGPVSEYIERKHTQALKCPDNYILYIGDINYNKNLPTLLLALTQLPEEVHLCVVSKNFQNAQIPEGRILAEIMKENDLEERVHILDVPGDDSEMLSAVISGARCLVQPSLYEGFGLPVLEAMQVGTVVVSSNAASLPEVAGQAAILVDPTLGDLAGGIMEAWRLRGDDRQKLVEAGQAWAKRFSWKKTAEQTAAVYRTVLARAEEEQAKA